MCRTQYKLGSCREDSNPSVQSISIEEEMYCSELDLRFRVLKTKTKAGNRSSQVGEPNKVHSSRPKENQDEHQEPQSYAWNEMHKLGNPLYYGKDCAEELDFKDNMNPRGERRCDALRTAEALQVDHAGESGIAGPQLVEAVVLPTDSSTSR